LDDLPATVPVDLIASILNSPPATVRVTIRGTQHGIRNRFTDIKDIKKEMLKRLEAHFEKWLNPGYHSE
jgi:hypothetical protein